MLSSSQTVAREAGLVTVPSVQPMPLATSAYGDRLLGLAICCLVPAGFWTALTALIVWLLGYENDPAMLGLMAAAIIAFLAFIAATLTSETRRAGQPAN